MTKEAKIEALRIWLENRELAVIKEERKASQGRGRGKRAVVGINRCLYCGREYGRYHKNHWYCSVAHRIFHRQELRLQGLTVGETLAAIEESKDQDDNVVMEPQDRPLGMPYWQWRREKAKEYAVRLAAETVAGFPHLKLRELKKLAVLEGVVDGGEFLGEVEKIENRSIG